MAPKRMLAAAPGRAAMIGRAPTYEPGTRVSSEKRQVPDPGLPRGRRAGLALVALFDLLDHLGHIVLVLAEFGGIFQHLLLFIGGDFEIALHHLDLGHDLRRRRL